MTALLPYIIPGAFTLAGIVIGALLTRMLNKDDARAATLAEVNLKMTEVAEQATANALRNLELQNAVGIMLDDQKKLQLKYDRLLEKCEDVERKHANLAKEFEKLRSTEWQWRKEAEAYKRQLVKAGINPVTVPIGGNGRSVK